MTPVTAFSVASFALQRDHGVSLYSERGGVYLGVELDLARLGVVGRVRAPLSVVEYVLLSLPRTLPFVFRVLVKVQGLQGYLAHKTTPPPGTLP